MTNTLNTMDIQLFKCLACSFNCVPLAVRFDSIGHHSHLAVLLNENFETPDPTPAPLFGSQTLTYALSLPVPP